ncbi:MAG: LamG domain-containing protein [Deltaproteobacteria bacterium]|nr:LamG domain-containing protein [Deltaproteobacteria bacterium]
MRLLTAISCLTTFAACSAQDGTSGGPATSASGGADPHGAPGLALGALDAAPRTIPYGGYVDFDGEPVNAGAVGFNFVIFPCATPGTGAGGCSHLWVARGTFTDGATWTNGWPAGAGDELDLPIFSGRFAVELGAAGQNPLPDAVFDTGGAPLYLGVRVEGRALGALQKIVPTTRTHTAARSQLADHALTADTIGDLSPDDLLGRGVWVGAGDVAPGGALTVETHGDATDAEVLVWERHGATWVALDPERGFLADPDLAAYYPFEETSGTTAADQSGHGRHLTLERSFTLGQPGRVGQGLKLGGTGGSGGGSATNSSMGLAVGTRGLTLSMWLKPAEVNRDIHFLTLDRTGGSHDMLLSWYPPDCGGRISFRGLGCAAATALNQWIHLVVVFSPRSYDIRYYADGVPFTSFYWDSMHMVQTLQYLRFGARFSGGGYDYAGEVDELAVLSRALAPDEVHDLYRFGLRPPIDIAREDDGRVVVTNQSLDARHLRVMVVK